MVFIVVLWLIRLLPHCFEVDEPFPLLYCTVLYCPPPQHLMIFIALLCCQSAPIMVFIVVLWLIRLLPHCFIYGQAAVLYCPPAQHLMIFIALLCGRSTPIIVFIVVLWLIRLLPHCFEVDEPFPLLYCTVLCCPPPQHLNDIHSAIMWSERSHNGIHSCPVVN